MTKRKKTVIISSIISVILVFISLTLTFSIINLVNENKHPTPQSKIFNSINEFADFVKNYAEEEFVPEVDLSIENLVFLESATYKIKYNGEIYEIYAYIFNTDKDAYRYYKNSNGQGIFTEGKKIGTATSRDKFSGRYLMVYKDCRAYRIKGPSETTGNKFKGFKDALNLYLTDTLL